MAYVLVPLPPPAYADSEEECFRRKFRKQLRETNIRRFFQTCRDRLDLHNQYVWDYSIDLHSATVLRCPGLFWLDALGDPNLSDEATLYLSHAYGAWDVANRYCSHTFKLEWKEELAQPTKANRNK